MVSFQDLDADQLWTVSVYLRRVAFVCLPVGFLGVLHGENWFVRPAISFILFGIGAVAGIASIYLALYSNRLREAAGSNSQV